MYIPQTYSAIFFKLRFCTLLLFSVVVFSQTPSKKLSKQQAIDTIQKATKKVDAYVNLAENYSFKNNDSALIYLEKAIRISEKNNYSLGKVKAIEGKGLYYEVGSGNYDVASKYYFKALKLCEDEELEYATYIYHSLGVLYHTSDNYKEGEKFYKIAHERAIEEENLSMQKKCLSNLASINSSLGNYKTAVDYFKQSFAIDVRKDIDYLNYSNLGNLYIRKKEYKKALPYLLKSTEINPENRNPNRKIRFLLDVKTALKDSSNMKSYVLRAIDFANKPNAVRETKLMCKSLFKYFEAVGDYKNAIKYQKKYVSLYEESVQNHRHDITLELEAKYQTEKTQEALLQKEKERKLYFSLFVIGLFLSGILSFLVYVNLKQNKQLSLQKERLKATVDEKNVLLKETHHRVKNSFQVVSSLLYLQSENLDNNEAKTAIKEAENRVRSMVLIHQKLYNNDQLIGINAREYFTDLIADIFDNYNTENKNIKCNSTIETIVLDVETMTLIGLLLNELIVNVVSNAFPSSNPNNFLWVDFHEAKNSLLLRVRDNGKKAEKAPSNDAFGATLIKALIKKLKGSLQYNSLEEGGTEAVLTISKYKILR